jgi:DNA helicase HerA-like ATPase
MAKLSGTTIDAIRNRHSVVLGMTRSGKTYFTGEVLKRLQADRVHTIFVDPKHDADYEDLGIVCYSPMEVYEKLLKKEPRIVFRTPATSPENVEALDRLVELVFNLQRTDGFKRIRRVIAIDELQLYTKKGSSKAIEMIWTVGAGLGIVGMALTQRMQLLNDTVYTQSENKFIFKIDDRPEYLRSKNLDHYPRDFFFQDMNRYWFYYTTGGGGWKKHEPASADRPKRKGSLRLSRW